MKKIILTSLFLLSACNSFGVSITINDISVQYEKCYKYSIIELGRPYCIKITNLSNNPIVVDPSIISAPLGTYQEVKNALSNSSEFLAAVGFLPMDGLSYSLKVACRQHIYV